MSETLQQWADTLQQQRLPAFSHHLELMRQLAASDHADMEQLAQLSDSDPGLAVLLLQHINQMRQQRQRSPLLTPGHAMMMLGLQPLRQLLGSAIADTTLEETQRQRLRRQSSQAMHAAIQARELGKLSRDHDRNELAAGALLHNLGEALLNLHAPAECDRVYQLLQQRQLTATQAQQQVFGFSFSQLSAELARRWHLPPLLDDIESHDGITPARRQLIALAAQLSSCARYGWRHPQVVDAIDEIADLFLTDSGSIASLVHRSAVEAARATLDYGVPHPAALLVLSAEPEAAPVEEEVAETPPVEASPTAEAAVAESAGLCLEPQPEFLLKAVKALSDNDNTLSAREVIQLALEGMHQGLGLQRVVFSGLTPDRKQLRANRIIGGDNSLAFRRFAIDLKGQNLFVRLMEKQQSLWLNDENRPKLFPVIPVNFLKMIDHDEFFIMSLFVKGRPIGLFYADGERRECPLDEERYKRFKQLVALVASQLDKA